MSRIACRPAVVSCVYLVVLSLVSTICAQEPSVPDIGSLVNVLQSYEQQLKRSRLMYYVEHQDWGFTVERMRQSSPDNEYTRRYTEIAWDGKRRVEEYAILPDESVELLEIDTFDGSQYRSLAVGSGKGRIHTDSKNASHNFQLMCNGISASSSLSEDLQAHSRSAVMGWVGVDGHRLIEIRWKSGDWDRKLLLDPGRNLMPIEIENSMASPQKLRDVAGFDRSFTRFSVTRFYDADGGLFLPAQLTVLSFVRLTDGSELPQFKRSITLDKVERLQLDSVEESVFALEFPVGTDVTLVDLSTSYIVGGDSSDQDEVIEQISQVSPSNSIVKADGKAGESNPHEIVSSETGGLNTLSNNSSDKHVFINQGIRWLVLLLIILAGSHLLVKAVKREKS